MTNGPAMCTYYHPHPKDGGGGRLYFHFVCQSTPPCRDSSARTWYAAGGMPLAFTQEDFLVFADKVFKGNGRNLLTICFSIYMFHTTAELMSNLEILQSLA